jgi:four helix bundle protein
MDLKDLVVYQEAMNIAEEIYSIVSNWSYLDKETIGRQLIRSCDSIAANISEGYGRYHFKENKLFCYYSRGSLFETSTWIEKAKARNLITKDQHENLVEKLTSLGKMLNAYIKSIGKTKY